jgi:mannose-6-phosphate isomerase-like protein (cupin superfamily)
MKNERIHTKVVKLWGYEEIFENNELYCGKLLTVGDRWSSNGRFHFHENKDETFFVISEALVLEIITNYCEVIAVPRHKRGKLSQFNREVLVLYPGMSYRILPYTPHRFKSNSPGLTRFIEVSTHDEESDSKYVAEEEFVLDREPLMAR